MMILLMKRIFFLLRPQDKGRECTCLTATGMKRIPREEDGVNKPSSRL